MSEKDDKGGGVELDFDWDDALADWERDLDDQSTAESAPMPQKPAAAPPKEPARALYRPPEPGEFKRPTPRQPVPAKPAQPSVLEDVHVSFDDFEDEEEEHTRIASIPKELIASLVTAREPAPVTHASTRPPPAMHVGSEARTAPPVDLDLDDMLEGLEQDTRAYPQDLPRIVSPIRTRPPGAPDGSGEETSATAHAASPLPPASERPLASAGATDVSASRPPRGVTPTVRPDAPDSPPQVEIARSAAPVTPIASGPLADPPAPLGALGVPGPPSDRRPPAPLPRPSGPGLPPAPRVGLVPSPATVGRPLVPPPGGPSAARPLVPPPGGLAPRPGAARPLVPPPAGARSLPSVPRPGGAPPKVPPPLTMPSAIEGRSESDIAVARAELSPSAELDLALDVIGDRDVTSGVEAVARQGDDSESGIVVTRPSGDAPATARSRERIADSDLEDAFFESPAPPPTRDSGLAALDAELEMASARHVSADDDGFSLDDLDRELARGHSSVARDASVASVEGGHVTSESAPHEASGAPDHAPRSVDDDALDDLLLFDGGVSAPERHGDAAERRVDAIPTGDDEPQLEAIDDEPQLEAIADEPVLEAIDAEPRLEASDDEPQLEAVDDEPLLDTAADDDEPVLEAIDDEPVLDTAADDDEPLLDAAADDDEPLLDADASDEDEAAFDAPVAAPTSARQAGPDRGAAAARRSVRSRKPRVEVFPLVGRSSEALAARRELLLQLASTSQGAAKARLLVAAAELDHRLGRAEQARATMSAAREADPRDVVALRAARRDAGERGAPAEVATLLEAETKLPLSKAERSAALLALAELQLHALGDATSAESSALQAFALSPRSVIAPLLMAEARAAGGRESASVDALRRAGDAWGDLRVRSVLFVTAAREAEKSGDAERALELHREAAEADPTAIGPRLGIARLTRGIAQADALQSIAAALPEGLLRDTFARRAARVLLSISSEERPGEVRELASRAALALEDARTLPALRTRALAATRAGDPDVEISALEAWAGMSGGTDRALALVRLAEAHAAAGDLDSADETLRAASLADASLSTIRIVREVLARRSGDRGRLVQAVEAAGALAASAKLAAERSTEARERELVGQARREDEAPLCAEVLWLDLAAAAGDAVEVAAALRHEIDRAPPEHRTGALLALADRSVQAGDSETAETILREARELTPGTPVVLRPLGRIAASRSARDAAALWLEESSAASGARAAFAASAAGVLLEAESEGEAIGAHRRALDAQRAYGPALWSLEPIARAAGDVMTLHEVQEQSAEAATDAVVASSHLVRAALLRADTDPAGASALLARAREKTPADAVLVDLSLRLGEGLSPQERAELSLSVASGAAPALSRAIRLSAAASLEDAGEPARAAELYRALAAEVEGDPIVALAVERAELHAGELSRVAERRFAAVRDAQDDEQRVLALERLADLDMEQRDDPGSAVLSLCSILEFAPGHVPSLRTLERYYLEQDRRDDLISIEERLATHLEHPADVAVHLRFASRLQLLAPDAQGDASDALLLTAAPRARQSTWLARRVAAAARSANAHEVAARMDAEIASRTEAPLARATASMRAAEARASLDGGAAAAAQALAPAVESAPDHPVAAELLAALCEAANDARGAADALGIAARAARVPGHAASLWYRAGVLWQDTVGDEERALEALLETSRIDVGHLDVFDRLRNLHELREDHAALSELVGRRTAAGGDPAQLVELHSLQGKLKETLGDREGAKDALRSALALSPEKVDSLKRLAELSLEDEDYRTAAEALIKIARVRKDRDELRWVFFTLGEIYDEHIPDPKRAEAAYRRVLKLLPDDVAAMERLAAIFRREGQHQAAAEQLAELSRIEPDPDRARGHQLVLAQVLEDMGDVRGAEQVLETARRAAPTEIATLKALAELYQRQKAQSALAMHVNRAVGDFRQALAVDLSDAAAWLGLLEVLGWRGRGDAARCVASTAFALGIVDAEVSRLVDAAGGVTGAAAAAADATLDDLVAPTSLPSAARAVMRSAGAILEKVLPFDPRAYRAEKLGTRDGGLRGTAMEVAKWFGISDLEIWITPGAPRVCVPVSSAPTIALMIGRDLLAIDEREQIFVIARALKIAREGLSVAVRTQPGELALAMAGLVHNFDPHYAPPGIDAAALADWSKRVARQMPRRALDELGPVVFEMAGSPDYDPARMAMGASELGDRVALLAQGSVTAAVSALLKLSGEPGLAETTAARIAQLRRFPEVLALASFAVSDLHFEARSRAGLDAVAGRGKA